MKIEANLAELIQKEPHKEYKTVIVFDPTKNTDLLKSDKFNRLMNNILSATLTGVEIMELSENDTVISIEPDMEMGIF